MEISEILRAFTESEDLPRAALQAASERRDELALPFIEQIEAYLAAPDSESRASSSLYFIVHLLAEWREQRAYRPVARLFHRPEDEAEDLFSDATTATLHRVMASLCDGDLLPIYDIILDPEASQWIRAGMCRTLAMVVIDGRASRDEVIEFLRQAPAKLKPDEHDDEHNHVWCGWVDAVAALNASELRSLVEDVFERGLIDEYDLTFGDFEDALELASATPHAPWPSPNHHALWGNTVEEFVSLASIGEEALDDDFFVDPDLVQEAWRQTIEDLRPAWDKPLMNAMRHVGRNDPCPCGSGKKYKKCCLDSLDGEHS